MTPLPTGVYRTTPAPVFTLTPNTLTGLTYFDGNPPGGSGAPNPVAYANTLPQSSSLVSGALPPGMTINLGTSNTGSGYPVTLVISNSTSFATASGAYNAVYSIVPAVGDPATLTIGIQVSWSGG